MTPTTLLRALNSSHHRCRNDDRARRQARLRRMALRHGAVERMEDRTLLSTWWVTNTNDGGSGSLRQAILNANADSDPVSDIVFDMRADDQRHFYYRNDSPDGQANDRVSLTDGSGHSLIAVTAAATDASIPDLDPDWAHSWWSIQPSVELPQLTHPVIIDGHTQPGSSRNTLAVGDNAVLRIELDGTFASVGLRVDSASTVRGLVVNRSGNTGLGITGADAVVHGCFIGTDPSGTIALGNNDGIRMSGARGRLGTDGDGDDDDAERNLISGNQRTGAWVSGISILVAGNYLGTDSSGTRALGNLTGVEIGSPPLAAGIPPTRLGVSGPATNPTAMRNVISGNREAGVSAGGPVVIAGNYIGTNGTGTQPLGNGINGGGGVILGDNTLVGSNGDGVGDVHEGNVVSGNFRFGIVVFGSHNQIAGNYVGTDPTGTFGVRPGGHVTGVTFWGSHDNVLGFDAHHPVANPAAQRNVISGNDWGVQIQSGASRNVIAGNFIGTDATGTTPVPNNRGIQIAGGSYNRIGTDSDGTGDGLERNIISANDAVGILFLDNNDYNVVAGNYIGLDVTGSRSLGNGGFNVTEGGVVFHLASGVGNRIGGDGTSDNPAAVRNVISSSRDHGTRRSNGILLSDSPQGTTLTGTIIAGNYIGTDKTGRTMTGADGAPLGNANGVWMSGAGVTGTVIAGNVIGGCNLNGIALDGGVTDSGPTGTLIAGNWIGTNAYGDNLGNPGSGIGLVRTTSTQIGGTAPGEGNTIAYSGGAGVFVVVGSTGNAIQGNSIHDNAIGISLGSDVWQDFPVLSAAYAGASTTVQGTLHSTPGTSFTLDFYANAAPDLNGYFEGQRYLGSTTAPVVTDGSGNASFNVSSLGATTSGEWITATATAPGGNTSEFSQGVQVSSALTTTTLTASANPSVFGQPVTFTAAVAAGSGAGIPAGTVQFAIDGSNFGSPVALVNGSATSAPIASLGVGSHTVTASYTNSHGNLQNSSGSLPGGQTVYLATGSAYVLNPTLSGATTLSGNATLNLPGVLVVDSSSPSAIQASGNARVTAAGVLVVGGVSRSGNASVTRTGAPPATNDPLASLTPPLATGLTNYGAVTVSGNSTRTLSPGIYTSIQASGNAVITLSAGTTGPGLYLIEGGGIAVTGNASLSGSNVFIFNAGSRYSNDGTTITDGGNFGGITLSGNGAFHLNAPTSGPYSGVLIYQARDNTRALNISGNAAVSLSGTIYAANALLTMSGNGQLHGTLVVDTLKVGGNVSLTQLALGSDGSGDTVGFTDTLLAGNPGVFINDPSGSFTPEMRARIQDTIDAWNAVLAPYNVTISEVSDPSLANLVIDIGSTSASGDMSDGVLGCWNPVSSEITIIRGWNWYAGSDPTAVGPGQFDFETVVIHELGHVLGLGHSADPASVMYATLAAGAARRVITVADLKIAEAPAGADPLTAAGFVDPGSHAAEVRSPQAAGSGATVGPLPAATSVSVDPGASASHGLAALGGSGAFTVASRGPGLPEDGAPAAGAAHASATPTLHRINFDIPLARAGFLSAAGSHGFLVGSSSTNGPAALGSGANPSPMALAPPEPRTGRVLDAVLEEWAASRDRAGIAKGPERTEGMARLWDGHGDVEEGPGQDGSLPDDSWLTPVAHDATSQPPVAPRAQPAIPAQAGFSGLRVLPRSDWPNEPDRIRAGSRMGLGSAAILDEVAACAVESRSRPADGRNGPRGLPAAGRSEPGTSRAIDPPAQPDRARQPAGVLGRLAVTLLAAGLVGARSARRSRASGRSTFLKSGPRSAAGSVTTAFTAHPRFDGWIGWLPRLIQWLVS